jgi:hypothetical protein
MIISFNPSIFKNEDCELQDVLARIIVILINTHCHFIEVRSMESIFFDKNSKYIFDSNIVAQSHLSVVQRRLLKNFICKEILRNITALHKKYLNHIVIGIDKNNNEMHPKDAYNLISERSKILLENGINDGKFIRGICQKYSSSKRRLKSIYEKIDEAIKNEKIEFEHCGGIGGIEKISKKYICATRYKNIFQYKLMTIFDSDRRKSDELTSHTNLIKYLKKRDKKIESIIDHNYEYTDLIIWHILYKKKIENYVPISLLLEAFPSTTQFQKDELAAKTCEELDFIDYSKANIGISEIEIKRQFPDIFLSKFSYRKFEERCEHHKITFKEEDESVSEIEQILLKIAQIL